MCLSLRSDINQGNLQCKALYGRRPVHIYVRKKGLIGRIWPMILNADYCTKGAAASPEEAHAGRDQASASSRSANAFFSLSFFISKAFALSSPLKKSSTYSSSSL